MPFVAALLLSGCAAEPSPSAPDYAPPPARGAPLTREEAFAIASGARDSEDAIHRLDRCRFGFRLDDKSIDWFDKQGAPPEVLDYLRKRSTIDYDATRGDVDPDGPGGRTGYVDPRRGFEDFAGTAAPARTPRGHDPWTGPGQLGMPWGLKSEEERDGAGRRWLYDAPTGERYELFRSRPGDDR